MKYAIITYGCTLNQHDSELVREQLKSKGYTETNVENADVVIINTCGVKDSTEKKIIHKIKTITKPKVVMGCLATGDPKLIRRMDNKAVLLGTQSLSKIEDAVKDALEGRVTQYFKREDKSVLDYTFNGVIGIIGIGEGCDSNCSYCFTKFARPGMYSLRTGEIIRRLKRANELGIKEVRFTAQDVGAYGLDHGTNLTNLLKSIAELDLDLKIRVGMANPHHIHEQMEIIDLILDNPIFYKFFHIPQQSGSNKVLKIMNRQNTVEDFIDIVKEIRRKDPKANIMTDIIIGHPGEEEEDFQETIELLKETQPDTTNLSKYSIRPYTLSAGMNQIDRKEINRRSVILSSLCNEISKERNRKYWLGETTEITILEKVKSLVGRNEYYKQVAIEGENYKMGDKLEIKIEEVGTAYLRGKPIVHS